MAFNDMREFCDALDKTGDIVRVQQEVDWELEAAAITRRSNETLGPAVLFEKIKDYPKGYRILGGAQATYRRVAISMGLPPDTPIPYLYGEYEAREQTPVKPVIVPTGPCKENIMKGDDVNVFNFPVPLIHDGDGGRYLSTWDIVITQDPDSGWTNWGMYRFMVHNHHILTGDPTFNSHLAMMFREKFVPAKKSMPIAIAIGADPLCHMVATAGYGIGQDEVDFAGALRKSPVELVRTETNGLLVPANAEIIIEGEVLPDAIGAEGPFGEYPGYRSGKARTGIVCVVKAITYRSSPILTMISLGIPMDDSSVAAALTASISLKRRLKRHGIPVTNVYAPAEGVTHLVVVGVKSGGRNMAKQIADVITARRAAMNKIVVVDEDVDVFNMMQVIHALSVKCHPLRGILTTEVAAGKANELTPCYDYEERKHKTGGLAVFDCTWPPEWPRENIPIKSSFNDIYPRDVQEKVLKNWKDYGLK
ncbi:UbiD family decarboxylase [Chloroflexota bacterium]